VHVYPVPDPKYDESNWWLTREGTTRRFLGLTCVLSMFACTVESLKGPEWNPDQYEQTLRYRSTNPGGRDAGKKNACAGWRCSRFVAALLYPGQRPVAASGSRVFWMSPKRPLHADYVMVAGWRQGKRGPFVAGGSGQGRVFGRQSFAAHAQGFGKKSKQDWSRVSMKSHGRAFARLRRCCRPDSRTTRRRGKAPGTKARALEKYLRTEPEVSVAIVTNKVSQRGGSRSIFRRAVGYKDAARLHFHRWRPAMATMIQTGGNRKPGFCGLCPGILASSSTGFAMKGRHELLAK